MIQWLMSGSILLAFVLYHFGRWRRKRPAADASFKVFQLGDAQTCIEHSVSFLVPAWNAVHSIPEFVQSFIELNIQEKQLILCVGGQDGSLDVAKRLQSEQIIVLEQLPAMGKQKALRMSLPYATGDVVFLTDIDCLLRNNTVHQLVSQLTDEHPIATGSIRPLESQLDTPIVLIQWAIRNLSAPESVTDTDGLLGANTALLRNRLIDVGGFAQDAPTGTDYTLAKQLLNHGHRILYVPNAEMITEFPANWSTYVRKQSRWLRNVLSIAPQYNAWREVRAVLKTLAIPVSCIALLCFGFFIPFFWLIAALMLTHSTLNRIYCVRRMRLKVRAWDALYSVLGDWCAAWRAGYHWLRRKYVW